ncbi:MAG: aspartate aminotransferase family protein [Methylococcaceae bacterium]|nr:MAG: aspartate aminotransferase family protein [Methylococcaceae bacterium]
MNDCVMPTYARQPVAFEKGAGVWLWDENGKRYLDAIAGVAVCSLGHANPAVQQALFEQAGRLVHTSNIFRIRRQEQLAGELIRLSGMDNVFFCNSGAEANEAALKIARRHGHEKGIERPATIVMENSFHGRTLATLSATGNPKVQAGFEPLVEGFIRVPHDNVAAIEAITDPNVAAILVEPVQGEGGVRVPAADYLNRLRALCDQRGWLLMLDEVQTGIGRTGRFFAYQHNGILPDVCTLAKALGNGFPIGACMAHGTAARLLTAGQHATTYGGNPLACAVAATVLAEMQRLNLPQRAAQLGEQLLNDFRRRLHGIAGVVDIRGKGLMLGIELDRPCADLVGLALERGLLINVTADKTIRLLPPLIMSDEEARQLVTTLGDLLSDYLSTP